MKKTIRILGKCLLILLALLISAFLVSSTVQRIQKVKLPMTLGWGNAVVLTGSMEPAIPVNAWVLIHATNDLKVGDVIAYQENGDTPVTHRILAIQGDMITTKGDANNIPDDPIPKEVVMGKVILVLPPTVMEMICLSLMGTASIIVITEQIQHLKHKTKEKKGREGYEN